MNKRIISCHYQELILGLHLDQVGTLLLSYISSPKEEWHLICIHRYKYVYVRVCTYNIYVYMYVYVYLCIPFILPMLMNTHINNVIKNTSASSLEKHLVQREAPEVQDQDLVETSVEDSAANLGTEVITVAMVKAVGFVEVPGQGLDRCHQAGYLVKDMKINAWRRSTCSHSPLRNLGLLIFPGCIPKG